MTRNDLKRLIRGPVAAVPTAFDEDFNLDLGVMRALTERWVDEGLVKEKAVIKVAAAMGEGPDLDEDEWPRLLRTVVEAARERATIVCGLKPRGTLATIEDAKKAQALGAVGVQVDLPIFHHPSQDDLARHFAAISASIEIGILIYNTWWMGAGSIAAATMLRLAEAEHVVAVKWDVPPGHDYDEMREFASIVNVIDNSLDPVRCHRNGGCGYIAPTLDVYPAHDLAIWDAIEDRRYEQAQAQHDRVKKPLLEFMAKSDTRSGGYRVKKGMFSVMGFPVGPPRPPTLPLDDRELAELRELMVSFGWRVPPARLKATRRDARTS